MIKLNAHGDRNVNEDRCQKIELDSEDWIETIKFGEGKTGVTGGFTFIDIESEKGEIMFVSAKQIGKNDKLKTVTIDKRY